MKSLQSIAFSIPAFVLIITGILKLIDFNSFVTDNQTFFLSLFQLELFNSKTFISFLSALLVITELVLGTSLLLARQKEFISMLTAKLFLFFILINVIKLILDDSSSCGCFGSMLEADVYTMINIDIIILLIIVITLYTLKQNIGGKYVKK